MSDSRDLQVPAGIDQQAELRESAPAEARGRLVGGDKPSDAAGSEQAVASKKLRVRIDPAHAIGDAPPTPAPTSADASDPVFADESPAADRDSTEASLAAEAAIAGTTAALPGADALSEVFSVEKLQQLRLQFEQLAGHLRSQQYQLDRREAQLHSQLAQQENEFRTSRLWFREHQQDLADREAELQRRLQEAEAEQSGRLAEREAELSRREQELESQRAGLVDNLTEREAELARREAEFDAHSGQWSEERTRWADAQAQAEAECRAAKRQWQEQADALAARHRELEEQRESLAQQSDDSAIAAAVRIASEQAAENAVIEIAAERAAEMAAQRSEEQSRVAEQLHADAQQFYGQVRSTLDAMRQFLSGQSPKQGAAKNPLPDAATKSSGVSTLPAEMIAVFDEFRTSLARSQGRQKNLEEAEALLTDGQTALDRGRQQLTADRQAWQEQCDIERRRINDDRRRAEADLNKKLQTLSQRGEHLERRTAAVDQLRAEVLRAQRETLELRLATDEIWAQLSGSVPPPILTQSLARIRAKLAEQYQLERAELADQQKQLEALAVRLEAQHDKLHHQKQALEQWIADRRSEIEGQASRLVAQEMELARRQCELEEMNERQQSERRLYEGEIRRLLGELRSGGMAAAAA